MSCDQPIILGIYAFALKLILNVFDNTGLGFLFFLQLSVNAVNADFFLLKSEALLQLFKSMEPYQLI